VAEKPKQKQYCNKNSIKTLKNGPHKKILKKKKINKAENQTKLM